MAGSSKRDARAAEVNERRRKALELRKAGATYEQIAHQLGYHDKSHARKEIAEAIDRIVREPATEVLDLELSRLDAMLVGLWTKAKGGDGAAIDRVLRIMDRRARYLGLDSPEKREHTGAVSIDLSEMMAAAERMRERLSKASEDPSDSD